MAVEIFAVTRCPFTIKHTLEEGKNNGLVFGRFPEVVEEL